MNSILYDYPKLDYTLSSPEDRTVLVSQILSSLPQDVLTPAYLESLADYLIIAAEKQARTESRKRELLTPNRETTISKYETSLQGLSASLESGEDGIYNLQSNRETLLTPKISITPEDLEEIPLLRQLRSAIVSWESALRTATGKIAYIIKKSLIEMRKDQYLIKQAYRKPIIPHKLSPHSRTPFSLDDTSTYSQGKLSVSGVSLMDPKCVAALLADYSRLKQDSCDCFDSDTYYLMQALEQITDQALREYPILAAILEAKIDGRQNAEIRELLHTQFDVWYTPERITALWTKRIPVLISDAAKRDFVIW